LKKFIKERGLHTDISDVYGQTLTSKDQQWTLTDLTNFIQLVENYPYVVDADQADESISRLLWSWITEIWKNEKWGLVTKDYLSWWEKCIRVLFSHHSSQFWVLHFSEEEYNKYWLIEVVGQTQNGLSNKMFLHKVNYSDDVGIHSFKSLWSYTMPNNFDRDAVSFSYKWDGYYRILYKDISSTWTQIYEILPAIKADRDVINKWFDEFNSLEVDMKWSGKVILRKQYDDKWQLSWICVFKKRLLGWEEKLNARIRI
jgi:hypothetical protein